MKKLLAILAVSLFSMSAFAVNLYGGVVAAQSVGGTETSTQGATGAAMLGLSFTQSGAQASQAGAAGGAVSPSGVVVGQGGTSSNSGGSASGALGFAVGGSNYSGTAGNASGAAGRFGTIGIGF